MKILDVPYHTQRDNLLFPSSVCGTTCIAMYLGWLNKKFNKFYIQDDDKVFEALHSPEMLKRASFLEENGYSYIKDYLESKRIMNGEETDYTHLNNLAVMLAECGSNLTFYEFEFKMMWLTPADMIEAINEEFPIMISGCYPKTKGHFIVICGADNDMNFICCDPYGDFKTGYSNHNGENVVYSIKDIWTYGKNMQNSDGDHLCIRAIKKKGLFDPLIDKPPVNHWG